MRSDKNGQLNKNMRGFTLVELIVVLVIVAILAAVAVPTFLAFIDRAKEKDYETNAQKCLASTQAALSEIFSDAGNSFSIKKRESVRNLCDSEKKSTEFIVWTKDALDSKTVRALPDYIASYTIEKALYEEAGCYLAYDGKKWELFKSDKAREEAVAFLSVDNSKAIYMWPYKQDLAYYPAIGDENQYADDDGTIKVVNLSLDAKGMGYVYFSNKGSDLNSGINTMKVVFWKESGTNKINSTWTVDNNGNDCFTYDDNTEYELYIDKDKNGNKRFSAYEWISTDDNTNLSGKSAVETYIYETKPDKKIYNLTLSLGEANQFDVPEVYISKNAFSSLLSANSAPSEIKSVTAKGLSDYKTEMEVPQNAVRIDDTSVKDGFVYAWYEGNTFVWWTNAGTVYMPADCSGMCSEKDKLVDFDFSGFDFSNTTNTSNLFFKCNNLNSVTGINGLTSLSKADGMFKSCKKLTDANITSVSGNIESVSGMFEGCESITSIIFSDDFVTTAVSDYEYTFIDLHPLNVFS